MRLIINDMKARVSRPILRMEERFLLVFHVNRSISELRVKGLLYKGALSRVEVAGVREGPSHHQQGSADAAQTVALKTYEKHKLSHRAR